jgi:hypothetical protein
LVVSAAIMALALLLPRSLPGELTAARMTPHAGAICANCPPTERLTAIGMLAGDDGWFVNVRFAVPPRNTRITLALEGVADTLELQQAGKDWRIVGKPTDAVPALTGAGERGDLVVFQLPATSRATGIAVATATGDRIPASGFAAPVYPSTAHFNATDVLILLVLVATAVYGFRRGALAEVGDLIAIAVSFVIAALAFKPLASVIAAATGYTRGASAIASGVIVIVCATIGFVMMPRLIRRIAPTMKEINPAANGATASAIACIRQLPLLAAALTIGIEVALLHWAEPSITSSVLGSALLGAWKTLFTPA